MKCPVHHLSYDGLTGCPACSADSRREKKVLRAIEESGERVQEAQRHQADLLERMREEEEERAFDRLVELNEIARVEETRLNEEREHRRLEQLHAFLRAGLGEFPALFRRYWREVNKVLATTQARAEEHLRQCQQDQQVVDEKRRELEALLDDARNRARTEFDALQSSSCDLGALDHGKTSELPGFCLAGPIYDDLAQTAPQEFRKAGLPVTLPEDTISTAATIEELGRLVRNIWPIPRVGVGFYVGHYLAAYLAMGFVIPVILLPFGEDVAEYGLPIAMMLGLPAAYVLGERRKKWAVLLSTNLRVFLEKCRGLANGFLMDDEQCPDDASLARPDDDSTIEIAELRRDAERRLHELSGRMRDQLFADFFRCTIEQGPGRAEEIRLRAEIEAAERKLEASEVSLSAAEAEREKARTRHSITEGLIVEVGREIVEGVRVAGRQPIAVNMCPVCHNPTVFEDSSCRYCGSRSEI